MKSYLNNTSLPRGLRNNNPGNLVRTSIAWQGKIPHSQNTDSYFEQFTHLPFGIRALMRDLISDYKKGSDTVVKLITEFAPTFENNTAAYINTVANVAGIPANQPINGLTKPILIGLCKAIVLVEIGAAYQSYVTNSDYEEAFSMLGVALPGVLKKKEVAVISVTGFLGLTALAIIGYKQLSKK